MGEEKDITKEFLKELQQARDEKNEVCLKILAMHLFVLLLNLFRYCVGSDTSFSNLSFLSACIAYFSVFLIGMYIAEFFSLSEKISCLRSLLRDLGVFDERQDWIMNRPGYNKKHLIWCLAFMTLFVISIILCMHRSNDFISSAMLALIGMVCSVVLLLKSHK